MSSSIRTSAFGRWVAAAAAAVLLAACGGGGGSDGPVASSDAANTPALTTVLPTGANVIPMRVDRGLESSAINTPFVTVTVCQPGTGVCQDIDHVIVDTGSSGLRIAADALRAFQLPPVNDALGVPVGECAHFASGFSWGAVRRADVRLGGQTAANLSVQIVNDRDPAFAAVPTACSGFGANIGAGRGARGILGIGLFDQDCGRTCELSVAPAVYFGCSAVDCTPTRMPVAAQVRNPVAALPADNNGVALILPQVPVRGAVALAGALVLGVGTQSNNQLGGATVYTTDAQGFFTTTYKGVSYPASFLDSGSNGLFFQDRSLPQCGDFYCPSAPLALSATNTSAAGVSGTVTFTLDSVNQLVPNAGAATLGGDPGSSRSFDWGLPFFFGRTVFVARSGASTPAGPGPFWAW